MLLILKLIANWRTGKIKEAKYKQNHFRCFLVKHGVKVTLRQISNYHCEFRCSVLDVLD